MINNNNDKNVFFSAAADTARSSIHKAGVCFVCPLLVNKAKKNVSFPETLPTLLFGSYSKFFGTSENFPSIFRVFWIIFMLLPMLKKFLKKNNSYLPTLKNMETFPETRHLIFWPKLPYTGNILVSVYFLKVKLGDP